MLENNLNDVIEEYDETQQQLESLSIDKQEPKIRQILSGLIYSMRKWITQYLNLVEDGE